MLADPCQHHNLSSMYISRSLWPTYWPPGHSSTCQEEAANSASVRLQHCLSRKETIGRLEAIDAPRRSRRPPVLHTAHWHWYITIPTGRHAFLDRLTQHQFLMDIKVMKTQRENFKKLYSKTWYLVYLMKRILFVSKSVFGRRFWASDSIPKRNEQDTNGLNFSLSKWENK